MPGRLPAAIGLFVIRSLKLIIKGILARLGLVIFKRTTGIYVGEHETPALALRLCGVAHPVIVDGGANKGFFVDAVFKIAPESRFLCFEPDPPLAMNLRNKFTGNQRVQIVQAALGSASGTATLNINQSRACNSLMSSAGNTAGELGNFMTTVDRIEVELISLDRAMGESRLPPCDILKLDLQGYELQALKGAGETLKTVSVVIVELWYAPVYTNAVTYLQICDLLEKSGFSLYSIVGLHYSTTDRLLWSDALFLRSESPHFDVPISLTHPSQSS